MIDYIEQINDLYYFDKEDLVDVMTTYSNYVTEFYEDHDEGSQPVSIMEFLNYEYVHVRKDDLAFVDDLEKMVDFLQLNKDDFLDSYEYLSELEYDATKIVYEEDKADVLSNMMREAENIYYDELDREGDNSQQDEDALTSDDIKTVIMHALNDCTDEEVKNFEMYCVEMGV